jgi:conjugal transfer/entry exclusion protein
MAAAQVLKATHAVDDAGRVRGVADIALNVDNRVAGVGDQVQGVVDQVQSVGDQVQGVDDQVRGVGDQVQGVGDQVQGVGDQVQSVGDQVQGVGDQVQGVTDQLKGIDDMVAVVRDGAQYTFNQSSKHHLTPNMHRWKRGQGSYATGSRRRRPDGTFVVSELHSCWISRLNHRHRESITTGSS